MGKQRSGHIIPANALPEWRRTGTRYAPPMPLAPRTSYDAAHCEQTADEAIARIRAAASSGAAPPSYTRSNFCLRHVPRVAVGRQQPREHLTVPTLYDTHSLRSLQGRITSFYGATLERYTSYRAHAATEGPVRQFLFTEKGILSISKQSVHYAHRRGITQWHLTYVWPCHIFTISGGADAYTVGVMNSRTSNA